MQVFRAVGWMVPAIALSLLVGTGPNTIIMALTLPLAQSALSLAVDTLWGRPNNSKHKSRTKRRPFARAANTAGMRKKNVKNTGNEASFRMGETSTGNFGGWDELDEEVPLVAKTQKENEQSQQKKGKLSRTVRKKDKPLVIRLLIAVFPFLGSWIRLL